MPPEKAPSISYCPKESCLRLDHKLRSAFHWMSVTIVSNQSNGSMFHGLTLHCDSGWGKYIPFFFKATKPLHSQVVPYYQRLICWFSPMVFIALSFHVNDSQVKKPVYMDNKQLHTQN